MSHVSRFSFKILIHVSIFHLTFFTGYYESRYGNLVFFDKFKIYDIVITKTKFSRLGWVRQWNKVKVSDGAIVITLIVIDIVTVTGRDGTGTYIRV